MFLWFLMAIFVLLKGCTMVVIQTDTAYDCEKHGIAVFCKPKEK